MQKKIGPKRPLFPIVSNVEHHIQRFQMTGCKFNNRAHEGACDGFTFEGNFEPHLKLFIILKKLRVISAFSRSGDVVSPPLLAEPRSLVFLGLK